MNKATTITDEDKKLYPCIWCGKKYDEHADKKDPRFTAKTPCLLIKAGFYPRRINKQLA